MLGKDWTRYQPGLRLKCIIEATIMPSLAGDTGTAAMAILYGDPCWSPRNDQLRTPPGPEGSNGSSDIVCRGVAGRGSHQISHVIF